MYEAVLAVRGPRSGARPRGGAGSKMRGGSVRLSRCMTGRTPRPVPGILCTFYVAVGLARGGMWWLENWSCSAPPLLAVWHAGLAP